ncbi:MAG TPA: GyrI-like domain-containing protein [Candidatus Deferrimicrobium sp.]|nr:GyrI-like domain-containing protein [Candidatus Deferrimicrobium sp.]
MPEFEIRAVPLQDTAVLRRRCAPDAISATMGEAFATLVAAISRTGAIPAGPVFARYFDFGGDALDFECGAAVSAPFPGDGDVTASHVGGCEAAVGVHVGPYDTLHETSGAVLAWVAAQGRTPSGPMWEVYLTDPEQEPDPSKWQTEIYWPVA